MKDDGMKFRVAFPFSSPPIFFRKFPRENNFPTPNNDIDLSPSLSSSTTLNTYSHPPPPPIPLPFLLRSFLPNLLCPTLPTLVGAIHPPPPPTFPPHGPNLPLYPP